MRNAIRRFFVLAPVAFAVLAGLAAAVATADSPPPGPLTRRGVVPVVACDDCGNGPTLRLYYLGLRNDPGPLADARLRGAIWASTDPDTLVQGEVGQLANVSAALSVIASNLRDSYEPDHSADLALCHGLLSAAGYPAGPTPGVRLTVDLPDEPLALAIASRLRTQVAACGIALELNSLPEAAFSAKVAAGQSRAFVASIDMASGSPYGLLERLFGNDSPENFTDLAIFGPSAVEALLAQARNELDPGKRAALYRSVNALVMEGARLSTLPLVWRYDVFAGPNPPSLQLFEPQVDGLTVTVNGVTLAGATGHTVGLIQWDWGDGSVHHSWFPASHTYAGPGPYRVIVTSRQTDGRWSVRTVHVAPVIDYHGVSPITFEVRSIEELAGSYYRVEARYSFSAPNDGNWRVRLHYLERCRDSTGKKLGTTEGVGGLTSSDAFTLAGQSGNLVVDFFATITSDEPVIAWPVKCDGGRFWAYHTPPGRSQSDIIGTSQFLPMITTWDEGNPVVKCQPKCLGGW